MPEIHEDSSQRKIGIKELAQQTQDAQINSKEVAYKPLG